MSPFRDLPMARAGLASLSLSSGEASRAQDASPAAAAPPSAPRGERGGDLARREWRLDLLGEQAWEPEDER